MIRNIIGLSQIGIGLSWNSVFDLIRIIDKKNYKKKNHEF